MQSRHDIYCRNTEAMSFSPLNRSGATKRTKNERTLPYKLLRFPASKLALWDRSLLGNKETLQFIDKVPKLVIAKDIMRVGHRLVGTDDVTGGLNGIVTFDRQLGRLVIRIGGKLITSSNGGEAVRNTKMQAIICFSGESSSKRTQRNKQEEIVAEATQMLRCSARSKDPLSVGRFVYAKTFCRYAKNSCGSSVNCNLWTGVATFGSIFETFPIEQLSVIPTALSKGLSDPSGNTFLHGEPKTGYLTMDELRQLLLILDTDPKVSSLPLFGIWVSGIDSIRDPFVWAACLRYVNCDVITERVCRPPDPFLIAFYDKTTFQPKFYDCILISKRCDRYSEFVFHSGGISSTVDFNDKLDCDDIDVPVQKVQKEAPELETFNVVETPRQQLSFSPQATQEKSFPSSFHLLEIRSGTPPSSDVVRKPSPIPLCEKPESPSASDAETDSYRGKNSVGSPSCGSSENNNGCSLPLPPEIYQLLEAQEQQLKLLKQQVDELVRGRSVSTVSSSMLNSGQSVSTKAQSSMATMTSFAWPPLRASGCCKCSESKTDSKCEEARVESPSHSDTVDDRSIELVRRQPVDSRVSFSKIEESLGNLQLSSFSELPDSPQSSFVVDLHDFQESFASSENRSRFPRPITAESDNNVQFSVVEHNATNFYDNLLRRIHTVLSRQSPDSHRTDDRSSRYRSPNKSVFDSLFLPRLNYISLQLSSIDADQSAEFGTLARKYLSAGDVPPNTLDTEMSLATLQYLQKYRLK